jgi:hypothetical protein
MSMPLPRSVPAGQRERVLRALGVTPWVLRARPTTAAGVMEPTSADMDATAGATVACVVVLPSGCSARELDLVGRALSAGGAVLARAARVTVRAGELPAAVPQAHTYLVLGEAQAHALGRALPAAAMQSAQIVLADEPALLLSRSDAKRRLWSALRSLRRALAAGVV